MNPGLVVSIAVASLLIATWWWFRRKHAPEQHLVADIDVADLVSEIIRQLDDGPWRERRDRDGVQIYSCDALPCGYLGFRTVTHHDAGFDELTQYLGPNLLGAFSEMNDLYVEGKELRVIDANTRVVRTSFSMPTGFASREFVHLLHLAAPTDDVRVIAYLSVDDDELPSVQKGYVRCPIFPSGQRLTKLSDGRVRVEHLMVYDLAGSVSRRAQNAFFGAGHVDAYFKEWHKLVLRFRK